MSSYLIVHLKQLLEKSGLKKKKFSYMKDERSSLQTLIEAL